MSELWNNTQIIDLQKIKYIFHTDIATYISLLHSQSEICILHAKLLPSQSIFMHLEYS